MDILQRWRKQLTKKCDNKLLIPENLRKKIMLDDNLTEKIAKTIYSAEKRNSAVKLVGRDVYSAYLPFDNGSIYVEYTPVEDVFFIHEVFQHRGSKYIRDSRR
jgi:hypothetical protein